MEMTYNDNKYIWFSTDGGKGIVIESRYVTAPYCNVTYRSTELIAEPEAKAKEIIDGIVGKGQEFTEELVKKAKMKARTAPVPLQPVVISGKKHYAQYISKPKEEIPDVKKAKPKPKKRSKKK